MKFASDRHWWTRTAVGNQHSLEGRWLPLVAAGGVAVALLFSAWRFEPAEDVAAADAVPVANGAADFHQLPAVDIQLRADASARYLAAIFLNGRPVQNTVDLQTQIKTFRGAAADATLEADLDCDSNLRYQETQRVIAAISSAPSADGRTNVLLVDRVTFRPRHGGKQ